jgi:hypothetical protein
MTIARPGGSQRGHGHAFTAETDQSRCRGSNGTSCDSGDGHPAVLGAEAGVTYTVTVIAHSANGDSDPSDPSNEVTPAVPEPAATAPSGADPLTTTKGRITTVEPSARITVVGDGYAPYSTAVIAIYSTPTELGAVVADANGEFSELVTIPAGLASGEHTITATGVDADGVDRTTTLPVTVPKKTNDNNGSDHPGNPHNDNGSDGGSTLPKTGGGLFPIGMFLIVAGASLVLLGHRRRWVS